MTFLAIYLSEAEEVSHNTTIDYDLLTANGVKAAFVESTRGNVYINPCLDAQVKAAKDHGWRVILSHTLNPGFYEHAYPCEEIKEAHYFWNVAKNYPFDALEVNFSQELDYTEGLTSPNKLARRVQFVYDELQSWTAIPDPKPKVMTYTSKSFVENFAPQLLRQKWFAHHPLHIAHWLMNSITDSSRITWEDLRSDLFPRGLPLLPPDHTSYVFWQFTGEKFMLPGLNAPARLSLFNGSWDALADWCGKSHTAEPGGVFELQLPKTCPKCPEVPTNSVKMQVIRSDVWAHNSPNFDISSRVEVLAIGSEFIADASTLNYQLIKQYGKEIYVSARYLEETQDDSGN